ncbi:unnamed protein product [Closterium sp. NIES-54]
MIPMRGRGRQLETGTAGAAHQGDAGAADNAATQCWSCTSASGQRIRESCCKPGAAGLQVLQGVRGSCCKRPGDAAATSQVVPLADVCSRSRQEQKQPPRAEAVAKSLCTSCSCLWAPPIIGGAAQAERQELQRCVGGYAAAVCHRCCRAPQVLPCATSAAVTTVVGVSRRGSRATRAVASYARRCRSAMSSEMARGGRAPAEAATCDIMQQRACCCSRAPTAAADRHRHRCSGAP